MAVGFVPGSLVSTSYQIWKDGNPPQPTPTERVDLFAIGDDGNIWHQWWDGAVWSDWENRGHPS